jgi:hypothetical protein
MKDYWSNEEAQVAIAESIGRPGLASPRVAFGLEDSTQQPLP